MRYSTILLATLLCAGVVRTPASFAAGETTVAREHAQKGKAFMDLGKYSEAAAEYEEAYADKPDPALLLNLAQAYRLAGNGDKAVFFYRKYLQYVPKSPYRADIEEKIAALEKSGASAEKAGRSPVTSTASGAPTSAPTSPPPASQTPSGSPGAPPGPQTTTPPPGAPPATGEPNANLAPGANPPNAATPGSMTPPLEAPGSAPAPAPASAVDHGKNLRLGGLIAGGVGVASFVAAGIFGSQAKDAARNVEMVAASGGNYDQVKDQDSRGRTAQGREAVSIIIGVVALAGGGVLYYLGARHPATEGATPSGGPAVSLLPAAALDQLGARSGTRLGADLRVTF
jgi:tetratricopeptide (TPR) repeat protein